MQPPRNYADPAQTVYMPAGKLRFGLEYRRLQNDRDLCIHVYRGPNDQQDEVLRRPCRRSLAGLTPYKHRHASNGKYPDTSFTPLCQRGAGGISGHGG
jgi:hypothetical protein